MYISVQLEQLKKLGTGYELLANYNNSSGSHSFLKFVLFRLSFILSSIIITLVQPRLRKTLVFKIENHYNSKQ
jgi:hypothetical protein